MSVKRCTQVKRASFSAVSTWMDVVVMVSATMVHVLVALAGVVRTVRRKFFQSVHLDVVVLVSARKDNVSVHLDTTVMDVKRRTTCVRPRTAMAMVPATLRSACVIQVGRVMRVMSRSNRAQTNVLTKSKELVTLLLGRVAVTRGGLA